MKLAHHGSRDGTDARWLDLVRPRLAMASLGRGNEFGHPHPETLALLERRGIPLLRTDRDGTIELASDGKRWRIASPGRAPRGPPAVTHEDGATTKKAKSEQHSGRLINVNTATMAELEALPGVGPVIAQRIVESRPYRSFDDLGRVKGIGRKRLEEIRPLVTTE